MRHARSAALAAFALVLAALVAFARPPAPAAVAATTPPIDVPAGVDLLQATGTLHLSLPANFFGSGSNAYSGDLAASGNYLKTAGAFELGYTNVVLHHHDESSMTWPSSGVASHIVTVEELQLNGDSAITVTFMAAASQNWTVSVKLADEPRAEGSYDLTRTSTSGGTWTASLAIHPIFTFKRNSTTKVFDAGSVTLSTSSGTWGEVSASSTAGLVVPQLALGVALTSSSLASSALDLSVVPAGVDSGRPGASYIDGTATISGSVATIGRQCTIGAGALIDAGVVIGPHASIGANVHVYPNAIVGEYVTVDAGSTIATGAHVYGSSSIGSNCAVGANSIVGDHSTVGGSSTIGHDTQIWTAVSVASGCTIGDECEVGANASIGAGASIANGLFMFADAVVPSSTSQVKDIVLAAYEDGTTALVDWPPVSDDEESILYTIGGGESTGPYKYGLALGDRVKHGVRPTPDNPTTDIKYTPLASNIGSDIAAKKHGGTAANWSKTNNCTSFASRLGQKLYGLGYDTTFTVVRRKNPDKRWYIPGYKEWLDIHALTDVHWNDGKISWIEPQKPALQGVDEDKILEKTEFDGNGNGTIEYVEGEHVGGTTDGDLCIEVFSSRGKAEEAYGHPFSADI